MATVSESIDALPITASAILTIANSCDAARLVTETIAAAAVEAQRSRWNSVRRLVRLAATKDEKLAALLAAC